MAAPPDFPDPPYLTVYTLEQPWPLCVTLLGVAVAVFVIAGRAGSRRGQYAAILPAAAGIIVPIVAFLVVTERERMTAATHALIEACAADPFVKADFARLIDETAAMAYGDDTLKRDQIIALAENVLTRSPIVEHGVSALMVDRSADDYGKAYLAIFGRVAFGGGFETPFKASAVIHWRRGAGDQWRAARIEQIFVNDRPASPATLKP